MIRLYALPLSGYCTKVRIVLRIKEIPFEESLPPGGHYSSAEYQAYMPPGTLPSIEHDGFKLFDSEAIVEYLEDIHPAPSMRAMDPQYRAQQRAISQFHNTRLEPVVRSLFPLVKQAVTGETEAALHQAKENFLVQLGKLEQVIAPTPFIGGPTPCLADSGYPATLHMGRDIFSHLGVGISFSLMVEDWLGALDEHGIIGEEVRNNRAAIGHWLEGFSR